MFKRIFGEYPSAILFLIIGIVLVFLGISNQSSIVVKIISTLIGVLLTLINSMNLIWMIFFDGKEESAKSPVGYFQTSKNAALNFEKWTTPLTLSGLALATGLVFMAFSWHSETNDSTPFPEWEMPEIDEMDEPPITDSKPPPLPPPPPPPPPPVIVEIVPDEEVVTNETPIPESDTEPVELFEMPDPDVELGKIKKEFEDEEPEEFEDEELEIFFIVEEMPAFPGGERALLEFMGKGLIYPTLAKENGIQGLVVLGFTIEKDGSITDLKIVRDIGGGCGEEAMRLAKTMPLWSSGKQRGKPVRVALKLPIRFALSN